jgi:3-dehydroquinate dehydratase / shikimate dehydrogenase
MSHSPGRICAVVTHQRTEDARAAISKRPQDCDLFELRLDYLRDFDFSSPADLAGLLENKSLPVIITCRAADQGGVQQVDDSIRLPLLVEGGRRLADYCDIELSHYEQAEKLSPDCSRLILSYHDFGGTPSNLNQLYESMCARPAAIYKIVTGAKTASDGLAAFKLLERSRAEGRELIGLAMGRPGIFTRVLAPSRGGFLTYGSMGVGTESAPGQLTCRDLNRLYRVRQLTRNTAVTAIIGRPVTHSASPWMHNAAFAALGIDCVYLPMEIDSVEEFFSRFVRTATRELDWRLRGFSVTVPHKTAVLPLVDVVDATAQKIGAVNTVVVEEEGKLIGYNTDARGAIEPLETVTALEGEHCAVIGAGGAARALVYGLLEANARVTVFARQPDKAHDLTENFGVFAAPIDTLEDSDAGIVINATPIGMHGHSEQESPVPRSALRGRRLAFDLVYNPLETRFLADARAEGCETISGLEMLVAQAMLQFELWTGRKPPRDVMRSAAIEKVVRDSAS